MMEQMTQFMGQLTQEVAPRDNSEAPAFKTPSMKAPDSFDGTQAHKLIGFIQSCQYIFNNNPANFFPERKKALYLTSFITGRACKWIEPYLSDISNEVPSYLLNNWKLFKTPLFTIFVDLPSFPSFEWDSFIIDSPKGEDLRLGYDFLYHFNPIIDWKNGLITYDSINEDSSGIKSSVSNALATAVISVALVGEHMTPSLSPVHIPSINPSQSLLKSRDEVFKEIEDVGEDVAISSLHFFHGDVDFPPSLEKQLDEEEEPEEIETVLEVVPPAYHQYLDVFSKVKAEKRPPHRACDHLIELEGLLPPVCVIFSL
ncbi:hypothetical protein O181_024973 [Austropuccinia psidii MF-1]|uniref:DUF4939 domain-containing protein n=1 Tax=Austropuccinia psidii MF-1 TaxID=1389203 RepID=A0A9Q3GYP2_9BASI|nr:hypothetical protein [Austropuccinia psidii MF-1]